MSAAPNGHAASTDAAAQSKIQPLDVGWQFVPQYYHFVNKQPHRLHCFYNKRSTFVHGEEGEDVQPALGQQEIHERITKIGYDQCKVYINSIDSQSSANGGIIIQVLGEMSNDNKPWRKFAQTFFLAEQPNGYFVLNDIFRYIKEDGDEEEEHAVEEAPAVSATPSAQAAEAHAQAAPQAPIAAEVEQETAEPAAETADEEPAVPEPVAAPEPPAPKEEPKPVEEEKEDKEKTVPVPIPLAPVEDKAAPAAAPAPAAARTSTPAPAPAPAAESKTSTPANGTAPPSGAATPAAQPAAPPAPAKPKSWATLAAGGKSWSSAIAAAQPAAAAKKPEAPAAAPAPAAPAATPAPAATSAAAAAPAPSNGARHPFYENAMKVQTAHCFVKLPNWSAQDQQGHETMDENTLRNIASRFGEVLKVEIVKGKACAFVEFAKVEAARKAIIASLGTHQGGEGGISHGDGKLNFETRKEKDERGPKGRRGGATGAPQGQRQTGGGGRTGQDGAERGQGGAGRGRGRGRGGASNTGDRK